MSERCFGWFFSAWLDFLGSPDIARTETQSGGGTEKTQSGAWNRCIPFRDRADLGTLAFSQYASDEASGCIHQLRPE